MRWRTGTEPLPRSMTEGGLFPGEEQEDRAGVDGQMQHQEVSRTALRSNVRRNAMRWRTGTEPLPRSVTEGGLFPGEEQEDQAGVDGQMQHQVSRTEGRDSRSQVEVTV